MIRDKMVSGKTIHYIVSQYAESDMNSIVMELQRDALDDDVSVSSLLRKALFVSKKLNLQEFQTWIESEINGYKTQGETPDYRFAHGELKGYNPYHGWVPVILQDPDQAEKLSRRGNGQSIAELEKTIIDSKNVGPLYMPLPESWQRQLCAGFGYETRISLFVSPTAITRVLETVRTIILNWSLNLEEQGIMGENLSFTKEEKNNASQTIQNVNNFYGNIQSNQIAQGNENSFKSVNTQNNLDELSKFLNELKSHIENISLSEDNLSEIKSDISTLNAQIESSNPKNGIINESLSSIKTILEGAAGSTVGQLAMQAGQLFFG